MIHLPVDAQLPPALCGWFGQRGFAAEHVGAVLGGETPDAEIARYAEAHGRVLVTKDDDFALGHPPGPYRLLWLRCGNMGNRALSDWLMQRWLPISVQLEAGDPFIEVR